jgi:hypothetical protein
VSYARKGDPVSPIQANNKDRQIFAYPSKNGNFLPLK